MLTLHLNALPEKSPRVIVPIETPKGEPKLFDNQSLAGAWLRVFPQTGKDVAFLQMLEHHVEKFAPERGRGVIIQRRCLERLTA